MAAQLLPLETWARNIYGDSAPSQFTLRRWAREALIQPVPVKHGRTYYVQAHASYVSYSDPGKLRRAYGKAAKRA